MFYAIDNLLRLIAVRFSQGRIVHKTGKIVGCWSQNRILILMAVAAFYIIHLLLTNKQFKHFICSLNFLSLQTSFFDYPETVLITLAIFHNIFLTRYDLRIEFAGKGIKFIGNDSLLSSIRHQFLCFSSQKQAKLIYILLLIYFVWNNRKYSNKCLCSEDYYLECSLLFHLQGTYFIIYGSAYLDFFYIYFYVEQ